MRFALEISSYGRVLFCIVFIEIIMEKHRSVIFALIVFAFIFVVLVVAHITVSILRTQTIQTQLNSSLIRGLSASELPQPGVCGSFFDNKVFAGEVTSIDDYPWMALIEHTREDGAKSFHCSGTLINKDYVLTAAHCLHGKQLQENKWNVTGVRLGEWILSSDNDCEEEYCADPVLEVGISEYIVHPGYNPHSRDREHDIALIRLNRSVEFTDWIKPLCMPTLSVLRNKDYTSEDLAILAGWGQTEDALYSDVKMKVRLNIVPFDECFKKYNSKGVNLTQSQLCAGENGAGSCKGDSGGPLMMIDNTNKMRPFMFVAGIASFGIKKCGAAGWSSVYTRVNSYNDWILTNMRP